MITISITPAAFAAIGATLPKGFEAKDRPDGRGGYLVTLGRHSGVFETPRSANLIKAPPHLKRGESDGGVFVALVPCRETSKLQ